MKTPINITGQHEFKVTTHDMEEVSITATSYERELNNIDLFLNEDLICSFSNYRSIVKQSNGAK